MSKNNCARCKAYDQSTSACRRLPPTRSARTGKPAWPTVSPDDWCLEFLEGRAVDLEELKELEWHHEVGISYLKDSDGRVVAQVAMTIPTRGVMHVYGEDGEVVYSREAEETPSPIEAKARLNQYFRALGYTVKE